MAIEHSAITDSNIHEPKGVSTASANEVYVADGAASGNWTGVKQLAINGIEEETFTTTITDVSTASSHWVCSPYAGDIIKIYVVLHGALGTADSTLSFELGGTAITGGNITLTQSGSAAGDTFNSTPSALNTVSAGQAIECITDGASTNTVKATITFILDIS